MNASNRYIETAEIEEKITSCRLRSADVEGISLWPIIRSKIGSSLNPDVIKRQKRSHALYLAFKAFFKVAFADRRNNQKLAPSDVFVLSNHDTRSVDYKGAKYNQLTDPVVEELVKDGVSVQLAESVWINAKTPRATRSYVVSTAWVVVVGLLNKFFCCLIGKKPDINLSKSEFDVLNEQFDLNNESRVISGAGILGQVESWYYQKSYWLRLLKKVRPKVVILVCYYCNAPLVWACKQMGIKVYDLQHGVISDNHIGYGNINSLSSIDRTLIPDGFLCWDSDSAQVIDKWRGQQPIDVAVIGNPLHNLFGSQTKEDGVAAHFSKLVDSVKTGGKTVLLTLQWGLEQTIPKKLEEVVLSSPDSWQWWIRLHPLQIADFDEVKNVETLQSKRANIIFKEATTTPLPAILAKIDVHVTYTSSVVIEAEWHGVKSIMLHELAESYYRKVIQRGHAEYLSGEGEEILMKISSAKRFVGEIEKINSKNVSLVDAFNLTVVR